MTEKLKVAIDLDGVVYNIVPQDVVEISEATLNKDLAHQPGWYTHYALLATRVAAKRDAASQALRDTSASVELKIRQQAAETGGKTTEDKVKAMVQIHPDVLKAKELLAKAERQSAEAAVLKEAFFQRMQALIALSANVRAERSQQSST